jgi:pimeloyl-ACP methyl ester carboxylesterase
VFRSRRLRLERPRAGLRHHEQITHDLPAALEMGGEKAPFVLVGVSMGGIFVGAYQRRYPEQVVGMVLIDAAHQDGNCS